MLVILRIIPVNLECQDYPALIQGHNSFRLISIN